MENYDSAQKYAETSANAFGTANEKYEIYMDSVMAKQNQLRASWEEFYNNLLNSDFIKTLLNIANALLKLMNLGDGFVGKMTLAMTALAGLNMVFKSDLKVFESLRTMLVGLGQAFSSLFTSFGTLGSLFKKNTASTVASTVATKAHTTAVKADTVAQEANNAVALANPWLAVAEIALTAVMIIVTAVKKHNEAIQESIDKAQELKDTYKSTSDEISDNIKSLTETTSVKSDGTEYKSLQEEFDALCKGVDRYGNNLSLTNEEYSRYKSICEQIVGLNPDLMDGYDSETEAIGNKNGLLQQTIELMQEEQRLKAKEYADSTDEENDSGKTALEGFEEQYKKDLNKKEEIEIPVEPVFIPTQSWTELETNLDSELQQLLNTDFLSDDEAYINEHYDEIIKCIEENKEKIKNEYTGSEQDKEGYIARFNNYEDSVKSYKEQLDTYEKDLEKYNNKISEIENEAKSNLEDNMKSIYSAQAQSNTEYYDLNSGSKQFINAFIEKFDLTDTSKDVVETNKRAVDSVVKELGDNPDLQNEIANLFSNPNIDYKTFQEKLNEIIPKIKAMVGDKMSEEDIKIALTPTIDSDNLDKIKDTLVKANWDGATNLPDAFSNIDDKLKEMSVTEIETLSQMDEDTIKACKSWDDLKVAIENAKNSMETVTFDSAMSDYANGLQSLQTQYETLSQAQEEYNEYGNLTASTMKKIIDGGLLDYLTVVDGQLRFNTQGLQDNANALQENAIASLNSALYYDLLSVANGTYNSVVSQTDTSRAIQAVDTFADHCKTKAGDVLTMTDAVVAFNSATGNKLSVENADVKTIFDKYSKSVSLVQSLSKNLSAGTYRSKKSSGSSGSKGSSSSTKSAEEKEFDSLKDKFQADEITINQYISGMQSILKKVKKGSDLYNKIQEELKKQKLDNVKKQYQYGEITIDEYINKLTDLRDEYKYNTEGYKELTETINKAKADKWADQYERASISLETYTRNLANLRDEYKRNSEEWKKYNDLINKTKLEKYDDQYDRGEINYNTYIKRLTALRKSYYIDSETYKDISKKITDAYIDNLEKGLDDIDTAIDKLGSVNTAKEQSEYATLLSKKYKLVKSDISDIQRQLKKNNLTAEQRITLQEKLNDLIKEEIDIHDEIEDKVRDYYENQKDYLEKQAELQKKQVLYNKELELYGSQGKELWEYYQDKQIEALEKERDLNEENNDLLEAKLKLQNALNNKTTKILTKQDDGTWAYTFSANMVAVKEAQKELQEAELNAKIDALQKEKDEKDKAYSDAEFWANRDYEKQMNSIANSFGDIDKLVQDWMKKYGNNTNAYIKLVEHSNELDQELVDIATKIEAKYETVGTNGVIKTKNGVTSFDTGGEVSGSGLALVHDKERVLTKEQNISFLKLLKNLDNLNSIIDISKINIPKSKLIKDITSKDKNGQTIINGVTCVFPNINSTEGLQQAILDLPRLALQQK